MDDTLQTLMQEATRLTQSGRLSEATGVIQRAIGAWAGERPAQRGDNPAHGEASDVIEGCVFETSPPSPARAKLASTRASSTANRKGGAGEFIDGCFIHAARSLDYKLYVPPGTKAGRSLPLVVMLHGCTQNAGDFAAGTGMNECAREQGFFVLYPEQSKGANPQGCWNWFKHTHQERGRGEPALIADLTEQVIKQYRVDARRVYIAGLSAGGAMAAIVAQAYPEVFAAVGIHSGLPTGAASNLGEALSAMQGTATAPVRPRSRAGARQVPAIVFHGDQDPTVHPRNGEQLFAAAVDAGAPSAAGLPEAHVERGVSAKGRRFTRSVQVDLHGKAVAEHWLVHGAGHAWSGGQAAGSYTDVKGPDATEEMLRFFFEHPHLDPRAL